MADGNLLTDGVVHADPPMEMERRWMEMPAPVLGLSVNPLSVEPLLGATVQLPAMPAGAAVSQKERIQGAEGRRGVFIEYYTSFHQFPSVVLHPTICTPASTSLNCFDRSFG